MSEQPKRRGEAEKPYHPGGIDPTSFGIVEVAAIKALANGIATEDQQRTALHFILVNVCHVDDEPYRPGANGERDTNYLLGMRRVGTFIRSLINADIKAFRTDRAPTEQG